MRRKTEILGGNALCPRNYKKRKGRRKEEIFTSIKEHFEQREFRHQNKEFLLSGREGLRKKKKKSLQSRRKGAYRQPRYTAFVSDT